MNKAEEQKIDDYVNSLYYAYGSGTGVLFGIPSDLKSSVRAIVKVVLKQAIQEGRKEVFEGIEEIYWGKSESKTIQRILELKKEMGVE